MYYGADGEALKKFNTRDAHGLQLLREHGIRVCVISTEKSAAVEARMKKLHIEEYHPGVQDKFSLLLELTKRWVFLCRTPRMSAMISSDLKRLTCVGNAFFCPADSVPEALQQADYVCKYPGGNGAVREFAILYSRSARQTT